MYDQKCDKNDFNRKKRVENQRNTFENYIFIKTYYQIIQMLSKKLKLKI
jgi:hypothetical protein